MTIKEIAKLAGVSASAVSIALNDRSGISEETRERILKIVKEYDYMPNPNSRRLLFNRSDNIAVLFGSGMCPLANMFYAEINNEMISECAKYGYNLIFAPYTVDIDTVGLPQVVEAHDAAGIVFLGDPHQKVKERIENLQIPYVIADSHAPGGHSPCVYIDYEASAYRGTKYLIEKGHERIGYFGSTNEIYNNTVFSGYRRALDECALSFEPAWYTVADNNDADASEKAELLLQNIRALPDSFLFSGDILAIGAIKRFSTHGIFVPEDLSTVSIDNILLSEYTTPRLTTVNVDKPQIARSCLVLLSERINNKRSIGRSIRIVSDNLIERESVKNLSK